MSRPTAAQLRSRRLHVLAAMVDLEAHGVALEIVPPASQLAKRQLNILSGERVPLADLAAQLRKAAAEAMGTAEQVFASPQEAARARHTPETHIAVEEAVRAIAALSGPPGAAH